MPKRTRQVAALPWRQVGDGVEILLVTTRTTKRWVIPKGWTMKGKSDHEAAAIEAYEEAGVIGTAVKSAVGEYCYKKILGHGKSQRVQVQVFSMQVDKILQEWPERLERERQWVSPQRALEVIGEPELLPVVATFGGLRMGFFMTLKIWWQRIFG